MSNKNDWDLFIIIPFGFTNDFFNPLNSMLPINRENFFIAT